LDPLVLKVFREIRGIKEFRVLLDKQDLLAHKGSRECQAHKDYRGFKVYLVPKEFRVTKEPLDHKALKVPQDHKVHLELPSRHNLLQHKLTLCQLLSVLMP